MPNFSHELPRFFVFCENFLKTILVNLCIGFGGLAHGFDETWFALLKMDQMDVMHQPLLQRLDEMPVDIHALPLRQPSVGYEDEAPRLAQERQCPVDLQELLLRRLDVEQLVEDDEVRLQDVRPPSFLRLDYEQQVVHGLVYDPGLLLYRGFGYLDGDARLASAAIAHYQDVCLPVFEVEVLDLGQLELQSFGYRLVAEPFVR